MRSAIGPLVLCLVVVAAAGVVYGIQTDRWGPSSQLEHALSRLPRLPSVIGDWQGEDVPHDAAELDRAGGIKGAVFRNFRNARTRDSVSTLVVCGRGGPISVHTPDICYAGAGYRQLTDAEVREVAVDGHKHAFWVARFGKPGVGATQLEIYWAWSRDGQSWEAPANPRMALARLPALYKFYVVRHFVPGSREENVDTCREFLQRALPEYAAALAPTPAK